MGFLEKICTFIALFVTMGLAALMLSLVFQAVRLTFIGVILLIVLDFVVARGSSFKMQLLAAVLRLFGVTLNARIIDIKGMLLTLAYAVVALIFFIRSFVIWFKIRKNRDGRRIIRKKLLKGWAGLYMIGIGIIALVLPAVEAAIPWRVEHFERYLYAILIFATGATFTCYKDIPGIINGFHRTSKGQLAKCDLTEAVESETVPVNMVGSEDSGGEVE